jgi:hypothetical protein
VYEGGRVGSGAFRAARWDLLPQARYMWGSVQTVRGCPKHCSFCSVENGWAATAPADGQRGYPGSEELRRLGFRFILLADDNFYPVTLDDLRQAQRRSEHHRLQSSRRFAPNGSS